jgi:hypothetical protein
MPTLLRSTRLLLLKEKTIYIVFFIVINILNIQSIATNKMNVWKIFRQGFYHLSNHTNLYSAYPQEYYDYYLYSPVFAVLFAPFSLAPYTVSYFVWNNLNMLVMPYLVFQLKDISSEKKCLICYLALLEMASCLQGTQSNVFVAALMLLSFISFERNKLWQAAIFISIGFYIKIFPVAAVSLCLLYPNKLSFIAKFVFCMVVFALVPLLIVSPEELYWQYQNWVKIILEDHADKSNRISIIGFFQTTFNFSNTTKLILQFIACLFFFLMYKRSALFASYRYRLYFLAALMIWVVIFNHAAEVYSYAIAIFAVAIWYVLQPPNKYLNIAICLFLFLTSIITLEPSPKYLISYILSHSLKAVPYFIVFLVLITQMITGVFPVNRKQFS